MKYYLTPQAKVFKIEPECFNLTLCRRGNFMPSNKSPKNGRNELGVVSADLKLNSAQKAAAAKAALEEVETELTKNIESLKDFTSLPESDKQRQAIINDLFRQVHQVLKGKYVGILKELQKSHPDLTDKIAVLIGKIDKHKTNVEQSKGEVEAAKQAAKEAERVAALAAQAAVEEAARVDNLRVQALEKAERQANILQVRDAAERERAERVAEAAAVQARDILERQATIGRVNALAERARAERLSAPAAAEEAAPVAAAPQSPILNQSFFSPENSTRNKRVAGIGGLLLGGGTAAALVLLAGVSSLTAGLAGLAVLAAILIVALSLQSKAENDQSASHPFSQP